MTTSTAAIVLAAGAGTRFAGPGHKLLADLGGRPVVAWAIEHAVAAGLDETFVVVGAAPVVVPAGAIEVRNERWAEGMATSLQAGVAAAGAAGHGAVVVGLGDQPRIEPTAWRLVAAAIATPIAYATYDGRQGHPVRLAREVWDQLAATGDLGARAVWQGRPELVTAVPCPGSGADIDTVEDLRRWS